MYVGLVRSMPFLYQGMLFFKNLEIMKTNISKVNSAIYHRIGCWILSVHEAVPGHHLQSALNAETRDSLPKFRKDLGLAAYGEGWGLYSEYLADEMGIYTTPYEKFGQLTYEMWRACRLVVDTGIHAFGWTRDEVVEFMSENTALSIHEINTETDRYIALPGQALSYKIGEFENPRTSQQG